jgi:predicted kinase
MALNIVFSIGPAGCGKSTVSREIARRLHAAYLDKDSLVTYLTEAALDLAGTDKNERDNNAYYQKVVMDLEYATLLRVAGDNLRIGTSVVIDAPFGRYFPRQDYLEKAAAQYGWPAEATWHVIRVVVDGELARRRTIARESGRDAWKLEHWDEFWATATTSTCSWRGAQHLSFENNSEGIDEELFARLLDSLQSRELES